MNAPITTQAHALVNQTHLARLVNLIDVNLLDMSMVDDETLVRVVDGLGEEIEELEAYGMTYHESTGLHYAGSIREMFERVGLPIDKETAQEILADMAEGDSWGRARSLATGEGPQGAALRYALFEFVWLFCEPAGLSSRWATDLVRGWRHGDGGQPCLDSCLDALECSMQDPEQRAILQENASMGAEMARGAEAAVIVENMLMQ